MPDYTYALEKLNATVTSLAEGEGPLRQRLLNAYTSQGDRTPVVDGGTHAPDLADRIRALHKQLTRIPAAADEGTIEATVMAVTDDEIRQVVHEIIDLKALVNDLYWAQRGAKL